MEKDFFSNIDYKNIPPRQGRLLISEPFLFDPYFKRAVILLVEHNENGSVGFILNRPIKINISEIVENFPEFESEVYFGGPVNQNNLFYIHTLGNLIEGCTEVMPGLFWGGNFEKLKSLILAGKIQPGEIRFFAGYSGWEKNQLNKELKQKSWIVTNATIDQALNGRTKEFWNETLKNMGSKFAIISNFPEDPTMN